jgi:hypothetical protein
MPRRVDSNEPLAPWPRQAGVTCSTDRTERDEIPLFVDELVRREVDTCCMLRQPKCGKRAPCAVADSPVGCS